MREWMKGLVEQVSAWPGVTCHERRFGGTEFRVETREIGHVHWFGIVDIPFTVKIRDALIHAGRAERHHWLPDSGWTTVRIKKQGEGNALSLLRLSYLRIQAKSADPIAASNALKELESCETELDLQDTVIPAIPAAQK
jgi:hypothetical protein